MTLSRHPRLLPHRLLPLHLTLHVRGPTLINLDAVNLSHTTQPSWQTKVSLSSILNISSRRLAWLLMSEIKSKEFVCPNPSTRVWRVKMEFGKWKFLFVPVEQHFKITKFAFLCQLNVSIDRNLFSNIYLAGKLMFVLSPLFFIPKQKTQGGN